jgi:hypothetical protein
MFLPSLVNAQVGGLHVFEFLELSPSARVSGLGGQQIAVADTDISLAAQNPASLTDTASGRIAFNHRFYQSGINHGYFAYTHKLPWWNLNLNTGIKYIRYGDFTATDLFGNKNGTFSANENAISIGVSKKINDRLSIGLNTKWIQSRFESYNSFGITSDLGVLYFLKNKRTGIGFVIRNIGGQLSSFSGEKETVPFDIRMGISQKLQHLPFRFSITAHHLHRWNILYDDPNEENNVIFIGQDQEESALSIFTDNLFRHLIISGEFLIGKKESLSLRFAYNHLKRRELSVDNFISLSGFSFGGGIKFSHFHLDYAYSIEHLSGGSSHVGLSFNVQKLINRF